MAVLIQEGSESTRGNLDASGLPSTPPANILLDQLRDLSIPRQESRRQLEKWLLQGPHLHYHCKEHINGHIAL